MTKIELSEIVGVSRPTIDKELQSNSKKGKMFIFIMTFTKEYFEHIVKMHWNKEPK